MPPTYGLLLAYAATTSSMGVEWTASATVAPGLADRVRSAFPPGHTLPRLVVSAERRVKRLRLAIYVEQATGSTELIAERLFEAADALAWVFLRTTLDRHRYQVEDPPALSATTASSTLPGEAGDSETKVWLRAAGRLRLDDDGVNNLLLVGATLELGETWRFGAGLGVGRRTPLGLDAVEIPLVVRAGHMVNPTFELGLSITGVLIVGDVGPAIGLAVGPYLGARWPIFQRSTQALTLGGQIEPQLNLLRTSFQRGDGVRWIESVAQVSATVFAEWEWQ